MSVIRLFSIFDSASEAYLRPFFSDYKANALRSFTQIVNDRSSKENMISAHPDQFYLFELGTFDPQSGAFVVHQPKIPLGCGVEFVTKESL